MSTSTSIANTPHDPVAPETVTQIAIPSVASRDAHERKGAASPLEDWPLYVAVFMGGCLGTALRYGLSLLLPRPVADAGLLSAFHTATFVANMCACFIYSWLTMMLAQSVWISKRTRSLVSHGVGMGMCGGFSTLSALVVEELMATRGGNLAGAVAYGLVSFVCGVAVVFAGVRLALAMTAKRQAAQVQETVRRQTTVEEADAAAEAFLAAHPADPAPVRVKTRPWVAPEITLQETAAQGEGAGDGDADDVTAIDANDIAARPGVTGGASTIAVQPLEAEPELEPEPVPEPEPEPVPEPEPDTDEIPSVAASEPTAPSDPAPQSEPTAPVVIPQVVDTPGDAPSFDRIVRVANTQRDDEQQADVTDDAGTSDAADLDATADAADLAQTPSPETASTLSPSSFGADMREEAA